MTEFDITKLEEALSGKRRTKKEAGKKKTTSDKPLLVPVDQKGKEVEPKDIKVGKVYGLKQNS